MTSPASGVAVELRDVHLAFGGAAILDGVTVRIDAGEALSLRGTNGAGKTSLLRVFANVTRPTSGTRVGPDTCAFVPPSFDPLPMRAGEWLSMMPRSDRSDPRPALDELGFDSDLSKKLADLSFGNLRKLLLAEAMTSGERLLIIDELTSGLDAQGIEATRTRLLALIDAGNTVIAADQHGRPTLRGATKLTLSDGMLRTASGPSDDDVVTVQVQVRRSQLGALETWLRVQREPGHS